MLSALPKDFHGSNSTAEIQVHPTGAFLYGPMPVCVEFIPKGK